MRWGIKMKRMSGLKGGASDHGAETLVTGDGELVESTERRSDMIGAVISGRSIQGHGARKTG